MPGALLFDLDGTLIDTDPLHAAVFIKMFGARGRGIDEAFYRAHIHGRMNAEIFAEHFPDEDPLAMSQSKEHAFRTRLGATMPATPGLHDLMALARERGLGMAVVTNAPRENAEAMLISLGLIDAFDTLVVGDECSAGKPDPAPYAEAMRRLGTAPDACLAFEDSPAGVASARAAGALCIGVRSLLDDATLRAAGATATIADFTDTTLPAHLARITGDKP
jgi:HAD superfamily hydrolase (TIGR01509 family)